MPTPDPNTILLILPQALESRRSEFLGYLDSAREKIRDFASKYGWEKFVEEEFLTSARFFADKNKFDTALLEITETDPAIRLPAAYCAALEKRTLLAVSPEYYYQVFPQGREKHSFAKLLTHEIAHRLHVRILNGEEEAMGPIWFYEGFAIYAADQFTKSKLKLSKIEMINIMSESERGSYLNYNFVFRYFVKKIPLPRLILQAKNDNFNEELFSLLD